MDNAGKAPRRYTAVSLLQRRGWAAVEATHLSHVAAAVSLYYVGVQLYYSGLDVAQWDWLALSGWATVTLGLLSAEQLPGALHRTLDRLHDRGLLPTEREDPEELSAQLDDQARQWAWIGSAAGAAVLFAAAAMAFSETLRSRWLFLLFAAPGGAAVGFHLGRMAKYGRLGDFLDRQAALPDIVPDHVDGAGGLKPIGDYFFLQARIVAIPAAFLAAWWFLIPIGWPDRYGYWRDAYLLLLVGAVVVEILTFVLPMLRFHSHMVDLKRDWQATADGLAREVAELEQGLAVADSDDPANARARAQSRRDYFAAIESLPTWPVDTRTKRRFSLNNVGLLLPVIGAAIEGSSLWRSLGDFFTGLS